MSDLLATSPPVLAVRKALADLAGALVAVRQPGGATTAGLSRVQAAAGYLHNALASGVFPPEDGANLLDYVRGTHPRGIVFRRVIVGLATLYQRPATALDDFSLATLQLTGDLLNSWTGRVEGIIEHRSQLGDAALAALATAPLGILRALGIGVAAAAREEDIEFFKQAAEDAAKGALGAIPWWGWALAAGALFFALRD